MFDDPALILNVFLVVFGFVLLLRSCAADQMNEVFFVCDGFIAFGARLCPGFAIFEVSRISFNWYVEIAVFTVLGLFGAIVGVVFDVCGGEGELAVGTLFLFVVLFLMVFLEVDVIELFACGTAFDVSAAVGEVRGYFAFGEFLEAIIALLFGFVHSLLVQNEIYRTLKLFDIATAESQIVLTVKYFF